MSEDARIGESLHFLPGLAPFPFARPRHPNLRGWAKPSSKESSVLSAHSVAMVSRPATGAKPKARPKVRFAGTDKLVALSVMSGCKCTFYLFDHEPVTGYVSMIDQYRYVVLVPDASTGSVEENILHKAACPRIVVSRESTLDDEPESVKPLLMAAIVPSRKWLTEEPQKGVRQP